MMMSFAAISGSAEIIEVISVREETRASEGGLLEAGGGCELEKEPTLRFCPEARDVFEVCCSPRSSSTSVAGSI